MLGQDHNPICSRVTDGAEGISAALTSRKVLLSSAMKCRARLN